jgi:hypothetical protein
VHDVEPAVVEKVLTGHAEHTPLAQTEPAGHDAQLVHAAEVAKPSAEKNPVWHVHFALPLALVLPAGHDVHEAEPAVVEKVLDGHTLHTPLAHERPGAQSEHAEQAATVAVPSAEKNALLHVHRRAPTALALLPGHAEHEDEPAAAEKVLAPHVVHMPPVHWLPAAHDEQLEHAELVAKLSAEK